MQKLNEFIGKKSGGFFVGAVGALASVAVAIVYSACYVGGTYYSVWATVFAACAAVAFVALSFWQKTAPWAPVALFSFDLAALLIFIKAVYLYLPDVFFGGFTLAAVKTLSPSFVWSFLLFFCGAVLGNVSCWLKQNKVDGGKA